MSRPEPQFAMIDLYSQLEAELKASPDAVRSVELAESFGVSRNPIVTRLHKLVKAGLVEVVKKRITILDGRSMLVTAYRFIPKGEEHDEDQTTG